MMFRCFAGVRIHAPADVRTQLLDLRNTGKPFQQVHCSAVCLILQVDFLFPIKLN
jgi:hypothetical protein